MTTIPPLNPERTALLLADFEPAILGFVANPDQLLQGAQSALSWARAEEIKVVFIRVGFTEDDYRAVPTHSKAFAAVAENKLLPADGPETQIHASLDVSDEDLVIRKVRFGASSTTDLYAQLDA